MHNVQANSLPYKGLVRPILEYCCSVSDQHHKNQDYQLEIIQRRAARFVLRRYHNASSVTDMLHQLNWESLCQRRAKMRLTMFYKSEHALVALPLPNVVQLPIRPCPRYPCGYPTAQQMPTNLASSPHSCSVEQPPSINSNGTIFCPKGGLEQLYVSLHLAYAQCTLLPPHYQPPTSRPITPLSSLALPQQHTLATNNNNALALLSNLTVSVP